ncbi:amino acid adenylation domain-containing protein [Streptomyces sp. NPDC059631]|uniref:amino acid adenylation domain-containing protein n=1 Tax=unclassified Streptomyces TaxID=2593676 RepID=UPI003688E1EC
MTAELRRPSPSAEVTAATAATAAPAAGAPSLAGLVVAQCRRTPGLPAVVDRERTLTYAELERASAALARRLRALGAGPDRVVALRLERSVSLAVAVLAVVRSGAAYLPLSPEDPPARLRTLLGDAGPVAVVTGLGDPEGLGDAGDAGKAGDAGDAGEVLAGSGVPLLAPGAAAEPDAGPAGAGADGLDAAGGRDLAYVLYTSGSTGLPKGVLTEHRAIVNRLCWMQDTFRIGPGDTVLQKTPYTFDVSVWEFFWPLLTGATLVMAAPGEHRDPRALVRTIREHGVTTAHFVPSMLAELLRLPEVDAGPRLRRVLCSGEALTPGLRRAFFAALPDVELHNLYGPTEAAVDVTHWRCRPDDPDDAPVPIGRAITGVRLHVLDERLQPVPDGERGELCVGGVQVARGYLNRPELTARCFPPDPYGEEPGARLYRTGDLARRRPDGVLEYHGRRDGQVKIGGVRIELGEVEAALAALPGVRQAAAAVRHSGSGTALLVGYPVAGEPVDAALRRRWTALLRGTLPPALVPAVLVPLAALPLTAHGKTDRAALPWPPPETTSGAGAASAAGAGAASAPGTEAAGQPGTEAAGELRTRAAGEPEARAASAPGAGAAGEPEAGAASAPGAEAAGQPGTGAAEGPRARAAGARAASAPRVRAAGGPGTEAAGGPRAGAAGESEAGVASAAGAEAAGKPGPEAAGGPGAGSGAGAGDRLAAVWNRVLGPGVAGDRDFFASSGSSLQALALLAAVRDELGAEVALDVFFRRPTLDGLRAAVAEAGTAARPDGPARVDTSRPLRPAPVQERMWFLQRLEPDGTAMNAPTGLRLRGAADPADLRRCLAALFARHDVLRTRYPERDGSPLAVVEAPGGVELPATEEMPGLGPAERDERVRRLVAEAGAAPFDLAAGPPVRTRLVRFAPDDHLLVLTLHHIATDGWSWSLLAREFADDWARVGRGEPPAPPGASPQLLDHAAWLHERARHEEARAELADSRAHWRGRLAGAPPRIALPADRPRPGRLSVPAAVRPVVWSEGTDERLAAFCRRERVTGHMALLALFGLWLARLADQEDVVVASPSANRTPEWTRSMLGCFVTTVPHRLRLEEDATFRDVLEQARTSTLHGHRHAGVPIDRIVADLGVDRRSGSLPLFQNLLVVQNIPSWRSAAGAGEVSVVQEQSGQTHYELKLEVFPAGPGLPALLVHPDGMFGPARGAAMARQLAVLADQALSDPDAPVWDHSLA